jgi:hypothetical protein
MIEAIVTSNLRKYSIHLEPIYALPGTGETWQARLAAVTHMVTGDDVPPPNTHVRYGHTPGAALDKVFTEATSEGAAR